MESGEILQQVIVGVVALGGALVVLRRVIATVRRPKSPSACEHCAAAELAESVDLPEAPKGLEGNN